MKTRQWMLALVLTALTAACSAAPKPVLTGLEDIPVPAGLAYRPSDTVLIESPGVQVARVVYRGRIQPDSLRQATRTLLESHGWRHVNTTSAAGSSTVQTYEKAGDPLQVDIYEGFWFTYLALDTSRAASARPTASGPDNPGAAGIAPSQEERAAQSSEAASTSAWKSAWERTRDKIRAVWGQLFSD
jgi:hypothetical protein